MISWDERIRVGVQAAEEWRDLPLPLIVDKILKAAGTRDLVVENQQLGILLTEAKQEAFQREIDLTARAVRAEEGLVDVEDMPENVVND